MPRLLIALALLTPLGCSDHPSKPPPTPAPIPAPTPAPAPIPKSPPANPTDGGVAALGPPVNTLTPPAKALKPGVRELAGLHLEIKKDGTLQLHGRDRWGGKLDTLYESAAYLREAIPVLRRSVGDPQAAALDKLAKELAAPSSKK